MNWREEKMKIKIIDLLNKVANGEEVPKRIKYENETRIYNENDRDYEHIGDRANTELYLFYGVLSSRTGELFEKCLNDEVEIIEDEVEIVEEDIKENPTFEEYMKNPEKYWNNLLEKLDEIKQYLKND